MPTLDGVALVHYLNGHLGVSETSLELMSRISCEFGDADLSELMRHLSQEVREEQAVVRVLIAAAGGRDVARRSSTVWRRNRTGRMRRWTHGGESAGVRLLESMELLIASFSRRHSLWLALAALPRGLLPSARIDHGAFAARVRSQLDALEPWRLGCAATVLVRAIPTDTVPLPSPGQRRGHAALRGAGVAGLP